MKTIYKYPLEIIAKQVIEMPACSEILAVQTQNQQPCIWAMVDPEIPHNQPCTIAIIGTGHPVPVCDHKYLGTCQMMGGSRVWHIFELYEG